MPTYTYSCKQCGHRFDQRQSFTDAALTDCPRCDGALRKVLNSVGIVFKGSGFYRTDSRNASNGALTGKGTKKVDSSADTASTSASGDSSGKSSSPSPSKDSAKEPAAVH
jgi:putative FmdB family regulatory protein